MDGPIVQADSPIWIHPGKRVFHPILGHPAWGNPRGRERRGSRCGRWPNPPAPSPEEEDFRTQVFRPNRNSRSSIGPTRRCRTDPSRPRATLPCLPAGYFRSETPSRSVCITRCIWSRRVEVGVPPLALRSLSNRASVSSPASGGNSGCVAFAVNFSAQRSAAARPNTTISRSELHPSLFAPCTETHAASPAAIRPLHGGVRIAARTVG